MLDENLEVLAAAWSGEPVRHRGAFPLSTTADEVRGVLREGPPA